MDQFADGAHVAALTTARPARGVIAVPMWGDVPWQALFIAALRNQCLTWGGQANLPVPWTTETVDNPLFWRLVEAQDPDLIISAPMSWADLEDLLPERHAQEAATHREHLEKQGFSEDVIEHTIPQWLRDPIVEPPGDLGAPISKQLIDRMGLLHWNEHVETNISLARDPASGLCVDVREFWTDETSPIDLIRPACDGSWDERLAICALAGDFSPLARAELDQHDGVVIRDQVVEPGYSAVDFVHEPPHVSPGSKYPFAITEIGLQWGRTSGFGDDQITVVAGDDAWDFALFYALRRLTSRAYWVPSAWADDDSLLRSVKNAVEMHQPDPAHKASVVSYSDEGLAESVAASLANVANDRRSAWRAGEWSDAFGEHPARIFCTNTMRPEQSLVMHRGSTSNINTPIPEPRTRPGAMLQWMVDARVRDWAPVQDPALGPALLEGVDYGTNYARAARGSITLRAPHMITMGGIPLEAQVATPQLRVPTLFEQLRVIARDSGYDVRFSDKGIYADEGAALLGGWAVLVDVLNDYERFTALWTLCFGETATWSSQGRRYWESSDLRPLVDALDVGSVAQAVARGLLHRGLIHKCRRCAAEAWLEMEDLGGPFRCPRCRLAFDANDPYWFGVNENDPPKWLVRVNEMLWQFLDGNGDIPVRAVVQAIPQGWGMPVATCYEAVLTRNGKPVVELDFCASRNGLLYIGEAKFPNTLGSSAKKEEERLSKLENAAVVLRADVIVIATGAEAWKQTTRERAEARFPGPWPRLVPISASRSAPPTAS